MPALTSLPTRQKMQYITLPRDLTFPFRGPAGRELERSAEKLSAYLEDSCKQSYILHEALETIRLEPIGYEPIPPKRTFTVPVRYYLRGRGEPLSYQIDDKE